MYIGKTVSGKGSTYDSEYFYMGDIDLTRIKSGTVNGAFSTHTEEDYNPFSIYVGKKTEILNKGPKLPTDFTRHNNIYLPFRYPVMITCDMPLTGLRPDNGKPFSPGAIYICNTDLGSSISNDDTPDLGYMSELTVDAPGLFPLFINWGGTVTALYSVPISSDTSYTYTSNYKTYAPQGAPAEKFITYPTTVQMHNVSDGEIYIAYNQKTCIVAPCANKQLRIHNSYGGKTYSDPPPVTINSAYNAEIIYTWETPTVANFSYDGTGFTLNNVAYPMAKYSRKIDTGKGTDYTWNTRVIPYQNIPASDGTNYVLPSRNRCFMDSLLDTDNDRIVTACVYETANNALHDPSTWPEEFGIHISYFDTSSALTFVPDSGPVTKALKDLTQHRKIDNVHKVSITKWDHYYVIAISTDWLPAEQTNNVTIMNTILLKVNANSTLAAEVIEPMDTLLNTGFTELQSYVGTCP
jgi:hypothetical protein